MILYGAGGHGKVVYDCLLSQDISFTGIFDDNPQKKLFAGIKVISPYQPGKFSGENLIISIGSNTDRHRISNIVRHSFGEIVHKTVYMAKDSTISRGSMLLANVVIQPGVLIGEHVIINTGSIIEHDCQIDGFVHVGPGAVVCGGVSIGKGALIGANATILPGISIGAWAIIGAGSVIPKDVSAGKKVIGNPGRIIGD
jgi:sugar O-acyltransferase (sialic acid O-acetyltransferase NeuD family)